MFTELHKANLLKLADGLEQHTFPNEFDMGAYIIPCDPNVDLSRGAQCDTICCALGTATAIVCKRLTDENWAEYAKCVFGISTFSLESDGMYDWLFSADWTTTDNTPEGAAKRIRWMLEHGVPDDWEDQIIGLAPLCYN